MLQKQQPSMSQNYPHIRPTKLPQQQSSFTEVYEDHPQPQPHHHPQSPSQKFLNKQHFKYILIGIICIIALVVGWTSKDQTQTHSINIDWTEIQKGDSSVGKMFERVERILEQEKEKKEEQYRNVQLDDYAKWKNIDPNDSQYAQNFINDEIKAILKCTRPSYLSIEGRYFDIHHFIQDPHTKQHPLLLTKSKPRTKSDLDQKRPLLITQKSNYKLEQILTDMRYKRPRWNFTRPYLNKQTIDRIFFAHQLVMNPNKKQYLEAEFYYYDTMYNIGRYGRQLPLCLVPVGKNNANVILKLYESILRQNYTNYRIAHVDDNSDDGTVELMLAFLEKNPELKNKTTFIVQPHEKNAVYNRHYANANLCQDGDIIVDLDTDDYLIGNQVFQLVNTMYQKGNEYNRKTEQVWSLFFNFITSADDCCPSALMGGQINPRTIAEKNYRVEDAEWRTSHLRTYLKQLYSKLDPEDLVDRYNIKKGQFYGQGPDTFIMLGILQLSAPKHMKIVDQFVYLYTGSASRSDQTYPWYCVAKARALPVYEALGSLEEGAKRGMSKAQGAHLERIKMMSENADKLMKKFKVRVVEAYQKSKASKNTKK